MKFPRVLAVVVFLSLQLLSIGCGSSAGKEKAGADSTSTDSLKTNKDSLKVKIERIPVEIAILSQGSISDYLLLNSNLETEVMADVYSKIQGIVKEIKREEGQYVQAGDTLLTLVADEYVLAEKRARVEYDKQTKNFERLKAMYETKLLSMEEFETARYGLETVELQWREARLNLDYTYIKSPISGFIGERLTKIGARIQPSDKLFSVVNNSQVIAVVYVPEKKNIGSLRVNQKAVISSDNLKNKDYEGWIKRISPVVDPASGTFKVTVGVKNTGSSLRPGMFVNVRIVVDTHEQVVLVPKLAVVYENEYKNVYVVRDSLAHKIRLSAGFEDSEKLEAKDQIQAGESIIIVGQSGMKDKTPVKVVSTREIKFGATL